MDTKYEFGLTDDGSVMLIDEVHTPDSSRFWLDRTYADRFAGGLEPENFDKEFVRLAYADKGYRGDGEIPSMPEDLWAAVSERYIAIYEMLTGEAFEAGSYPIEPRLKENLKKLGVIRNDQTIGCDFDRFQSGFGTRRKNIRCLQRALESRP